MTGQTPAWQGAGRGKGPRPTGVCTVAVLPGTPRRHRHTRSTRLLGQQCRHRAWNSGFSARCVLFIICLMAPEDCKSRWGRNHPAHFGEGQRVKGGGPPGWSLPQPRAHPRMGLGAHGGPRHLETRQKDCLPWEPAPKPWHLPRARKARSHLFSPRTPALCAAHPSSTQTARA